MDAMIYNVSSITNAMRGRDLLERNGLKAYIGRATDNNDNNGCGYNIKVVGDQDKAVRLLTAAGIRIRGTKRA